MIISYALGSVNGAYYVTKFMAGKDIRLLGSGNAGARNAGRQVGKKGFVLTLIIDIAKTILALLIASFLTDGNYMAVILGSAAVLLGHLYPVHLRFRGGKGVVVFLSATLFLVPAAILVTGIVMGVGYLLFRKFTVPGLVSLSTIPISSYFFTANWVYTIGLLLLLMAVILAHTKKGPPSSTT
ncbi:glycerol-3-phosphate acyltransferase [Bacillus sp. V59.32b]|uniref:glycerol-3-phosphate acyltransferase n=1 Tax=Bacillus sp. V59.32b TaxID=1758642 RepID=UPI000E3E221C|nr:glycerol-3-phosphate acyltransferase [Bacillus sp. V59.32b]RFU60155.1 glycerol-3-phosphate acyltransferase [Bacillus sp. V59.32b]